MGPIDYTTQVQSPIQAALQGYGAGAAIRNDQQQQAALQAQQQAALQAQQRAMQEQQMLSELGSNPNANADDYARVMGMMPKNAEALSKAWDAKSKGRQLADAAELNQFIFAMKSGRGDVVIQRLNDRAAAIEQGGAPTRESRALRDQALLAKDHPEFWTGMAQATLTANPNAKDMSLTDASRGGEKRANELQPSVVDKSVADAASAKVTAKYAESDALQSLAKKGWDIDKIKADIDIAKETNRIAAMNAAATREGNSLKRDELMLKVKEARMALNEKITAKAAEAESGATSMDNFLNTADRFLTAATDKQGKPNSTIRAASGPVDSRMPTMQGDVADLEAIVETLGSQAFLSQVPSMKGLGALTEAEGAKLQSSIANLSLKQSPEQIISNVKEAQRLILKGRKTLELRTGVKLAPPDTPAANPSANEIDSLLKKYGK